MRICIACKTSGKRNFADHKDLIYHGRSGPSVVDLCYGHSVELFKNGQTNFVSKYRPHNLEYSFYPKEVVNPLSNFFVFNSLK